MNVYDFDKTIYHGDSTFRFYLFCMKRHKKILLLVPSLAGAFLRYSFSSKYSKTQFKEVMYRFLGYVDAEKDVEDFWQENIKRIKKWYLDTQKEDDVIISASPEFLLKPICDKLGIKYLMASRVDAHTGKYTGENCHGKEKVRRFREMFGDAEIDEFYSDSYVDFPLVEISKYSMRVKGEKLVKW